jgi:hypothetical protein
MLMSSRRSASSAYMVAVTLVIIPLLDVATSTLPAHPNSPLWRVSALDQFADAGMVVLTGTLVAVITAVSMDHVKLQRVLRVGAWCAAGLLALAAALLGIEVLRTRAMVEPTLRVTFLLTSLAGLSKFVLDGLSMILLGRACQSTHRIRTPVSSMTIPLMRRDTTAYSRMGR